MATKSKAKTDKKPAKTGIDIKLIKAISHPERLRIFQALTERVASPTQLSIDFGLPVNFLSYHFRQLEKYECIELVRTKQRRGALEHFYRAIKRPHLGKTEWLLVPEPMREELSGTSVAKMGEDISASLVAGKFEGRPNRHFTYLPTLIDEEGWLEAAELMDETLDRFYDIIAAGRKRMAETGATAFPMCFTMLGFEMASTD